MIRQFYLFCGKYGILTNAMVKLKEQTSIGMVVQPAFCGKGTHPTLKGLELCTKQG